MATTLRRGNNYPQGPDAPNVHADIEQLALDLDDAPRDNQGVIGSRPVQSGGTPGMAGEWWTSTDELDEGAVRRRVYRGHGTGYDEFATVPVSRRMLATGAAGGAGGAFLARAVGGQVLGAAALLALATEVYDYDTAFTGSRYTAEDDALMQFSVHVAATNSTTADAPIDAYLLRRPGGAAANLATQTVGHDRGQGTNVDLHAGFSVPVPVAAGDVLEVWAAQPNGKPVIAGTTYFAGQVIGLL